MKLIRVLFVCLFVNLQACNNGTVGPTGDTVYNKEESTEQCNIGDRLTQVAISRSSDIEYPDRVLLNKYKDISTEDLLKQGIEHYKKAIHFNPQSAKAYNGMGNAFRELGKMDEAIQSYTKSGQVDPKFPWGHTNLGDLYVRKGLYAKAIPEYMMFLQINPPYGRSEVHYKLGNIYLHMGNKESAIKEFQQAISVAAQKGIWKEFAEKKLKEISQ